MNIWKIYNNEDDDIRKRQRTDSIKEKNPPRYSLCLGELKSSQCPISVGIVNQIKYLIKFYIKYRTVS